MDIKRIIDDAVAQNCVGNCYGSMRDAVVERDVVESAGQKILNNGIVE